MFGSLATQRMVLMGASALLAALISIFVFWKPASGEATVPDGFDDLQFATGLVAPMAMEFAPDGRLFVAERQGTIRVIEEDGTLLAQPFVTIPKADHLDTRDQRGILGITFHPDFPEEPDDPTNRFVYVHYTQEDPNGGPSHNRIVRFTEVAADDGATEPTNEAAEPGRSGDPIFEMDNLGESTKHNGGHIHFGNDGKLYIPVGENKRNKFPPIIENLFSLDHLFGKVLRINADGTIPADNPFLSRTTGKYGAIYARGFRNPYSFGVEPAPGSRIYINDVGERTWEEINELSPGENYGWPVCEGLKITGSKRQDCPDRYTDPLFAYSQVAERAPGDECAITAGTFYPESGSFPSKYRGDYFFADLCAGWIKRLDKQFDPTTDNWIRFATGASFPIDLKVGPDGGLYYLENGTSSVRRIVATSTGG